MISPDYKCLFSNPGYCFYLFGKGSGITCGPKFQPISLENRNWLRPILILENVRLIEFYLVWIFFIIVNVHRLEIYYHT